MTKEQAVSLVESRSFSKLINLLEDLGLITPHHYLELLAVIETCPDAIDWVRTLERCYAK